MKQRFVGLKITACVCAAFGWWGVLYPELVLTPDTYRVCQETEGKVQQQSGEEIYFQLLEAEKGEIHFRSRLLEKWSEIMEATYESDK